MTPEEEAAELLPCNCRHDGVGIGRRKWHLSDCPAKFQAAVAERLANYREQVRQRDRDSAESLALAGKVMIDKDSRVAALEAENAHLRAAILWALGEGDSDFESGQIGHEGRYWWRKELRKRAALAGRSK